MKTLLLSLLSLLAISSCDIIERPYGQAIDPNDTVLPEIPRRILLEEFTGYRCANCPATADHMKALKALYPDRVELLTIHFGGFANLLGTYENEKDLTSATSQEIHDLFGVNSYPRIAVSREDIDGQKAISTGKLESAMKDLMFVDPSEESVPLLADMDIFTNASYNGNNNIELESKVFYVNDSELDHHIVHYVVEDSIVAAQLDSRSKPDPLIPDYVHTNVLRGNINGVFGAHLSDSVIERGDTLTLSSQYTIPSPDWRREKLYILTLVTDGSGGPILQVAKTKVQAN